MSRSISSRATLFQPDDPLEPRAAVFAEPWHAQALALADALVSAGRVDANEWGRALGAELRRAEARGEADTEDTYYRCVVSALEAITLSDGLVTAEDRGTRRDAWEAAYRCTPHGQPVRLPET